ncbi:unnamed protein product [Brugia timori]|uniref:Uncharacterized protein n=1 Tax=Brugia timori TaxID=42155 RepID=A0A3P7SQ21_9BILA|nr:unnamed protein product [Brugia timori]
MHETEETSFKKQTPCKVGLNVFEASKKKRYLASMFKEELKLFIRNLYDKLF